MSIYELAMTNKTMRKEILIEFGFGKVSPLEVEKWVKRNYPMVYKELKKEKGNDVVIQMQAESMTLEERNNILDIAMSKNN